MFFFINSSHSDLPEPRASRKDEERECAWILLLQTWKTIANNSKYFLHNMWFQKVDPWLYWPNLWMLTCAHICLCPDVCWWVQLWELANSQIKAELSLAIKTLDLPNQTLVDNSVKPHTRILFLGDFLRGVTFEFALSFKRVPEGLKLKIPRFQRFLERINFWGCFHF